MIWMATASLINPATSSTRLFSRQEIESQVMKLFGAKITPLMITKHLVSWEDRMADKSSPSRGGSRNRYLFRTSNGSTPDSGGDFRLYKVRDGVYDGWDKTGKTHPKFDAISPEYHPLMSWYLSEYFG